jgi:hypothetical protein
MKISTPSVFSNVLITQYWNVNPAPEKVEPVTELANMFLSISTRRGRTIDPERAKLGHQMHVLN